ncbi:MAG: gamma-glutamyl-gamma-aminobutyrate hydrolase family protein [Intrasporangium sp.]|uniref:gamma-glutamyl-gamma-aminobutyrate hydrolase family protein n=1 Tax=Intrasporangium sp. TaxID=1925024 RepID=UPI002647C9C0|nr:gamma-glutamyl-gamma-aminobutyrate hydrolase family protein [Intrasporangium sp.]MDN5794713.1 gamma-glutamyl-gamma-aminobutyrate hydrolase family protein [Intrasporangium sp.]
MVRPVIGITTYVEPATRGDWVEVPSALVPYAYVRQVEQAGGLVVLVPPRLDGDDDLVREVLTRLDGVIISGGADVAPERYGATAHHAVRGCRPDRDTTELAVARVTAQLDVPVLGICRGMQVMAVAAGGVLEQHVPERVGHDGHSPAPAAYGTHAVATVPGTVVAHLLGERLEVPCHHHQSVLTHPGCAASAWAPDGTLEAIEDAAARFRLAVQWHPEEGTDPRLFDALVAAAKWYAAERAGAGG